MVIAVGKLKDGDDAYVKADIEDVVRAARGKALTKVIIETCLLTDEEKRRACLLAKEAGADFVKTSTGFAAGGATAADVKLMRESVGKMMGDGGQGGRRRPNPSGRRSDARCRSDTARHIERREDRRGIRKETRQKSAVVRQARIAAFR